MSIKTIPTNPPTIALQIIGGVLILASMVGFRSGGMLWPMLGSVVGTGLLILGWQRTKQNLATQQDDQEKPEAVRSGVDVDRWWVCAETVSLVADAIFLSNRISLLHFGGNAQPFAKLSGAEAAHVSASSCEDALTFNSMKLVFWHTKLS
jgi:K+ transporter